MNKSDLVNAMVEASGVKKKEAEDCLKGLLDAITNELVNDGQVTLIGFGTFSVLQRSARQGKNPQTGETIQIAAKKVPKFKAGKALTDAVNG